MKRWRFKYGGEVEKVRLMALSMDNVGLRRSLRTYASRIKNANSEKRGGALAAPPKEQTRPGWGEAASSFPSLYRFFYRSNLRAVPIACLFKIEQS
jgi:hypothetical protein